MLWLCLCYTCAYACVNAFLSFSDRHVGSASAAAATLAAVAAVTAAAAAAAFGLKLSYLTNRHVCSAFAKRNVT